MHDKLLDHVVINVNDGSVLAGVGLGISIALVLIIATVVWLSWRRK